MFTAAFAILITLRRKFKILFCDAKVLFFSDEKDAEDRLFNGASIEAVRADNATLSRLRECAVYEVCVACIDLAILPLLASEGFSPIRAALLARVRAVGQPLGAL